MDLLNRGADLQFAAEALQILEVYPKRHFGKARNLSEMGEIVS